MTSLMKRDENKGSPEPRVSAKASEASETTDAPNEVLAAAGVGLTPDDPTLPCLTLRMWTIGIGFCLLGSGLNTLYTFRTPTITLSQSAIQFLAYPIGKAWEKVVPDWSIPVFGGRVRLNPGPFSHKENILIYIMANLSFLTRLSADVLTEQRYFYGIESGWAFEILITLATILIGFSLAGIFKSIVVDPPGLLWPGVLGNTALNNTLHSIEKDVNKVNGWKMSRYMFFMIAFCASFCWYWFPDFIFPALSYFTFMCWIFPKNPVVNQIFGMESGIGLLPITFDWGQIAYIGSPLVVPTWAIANVLASLIVWIYIVSPALYYTNVWYSAYLPIQSSSVFDNKGQTYNVSKVINQADGFVFDEAKYQAYSPLYMPLTYALNMFGLSFATIVSLVVWICLEKHASISKALRSIKARHLGKNEASTESTYKDVPVWWYLISFVLSLLLAMFACEYWSVQLRWYGVLLAVAVSTILFVPLAIVYATANIKINIDIFCRIIAGFVFPGKVLANIWFFDLGYISGIKGLAFAQDFKLGVYCDIPPRHLFLVQCTGIVLSTVSQVGVINWALNHIPGICTTTALNGFTCPFSRTKFNTSMIWGAIGPRRFFSSGAVYYPLLYFFILGAILPVLVYFLKRRYPTSFWRFVHVPLFLGALNYLPPVSGTNYGSWAIVGLIFGWFIRRRMHEWWRKYVFVLSSALDCSVAIAGVLIFFAIFYSGASENFSWWGTTVYKNTCDWNSCPYLSLGTDDHFGE